MKLDFQVKVEDESWVGEEGILERSTEKCAVRRFMSLTFCITWQKLIVFFMTYDLCLTIFPRKLNEDEKLNFYISLCAGYCVWKIQNMWIAVGCRTTDSHMKYIVKIPANSFPYFEAQLSKSDTNLSRRSLYWNPQLLVVCLIVIFNHYNV